MPPQSSNDRGAIDRGVIDPTLLRPVHTLLCYLLVSVPTTRPVLNTGGLVPRYTVSTVTLTALSHHEQNGRVPGAGDCDH
jgi:hypothetical protein